jgi:hypothetical protein
MTTREVNGKPITYISPAPQSQAYTGPIWDLNITPRDTPAYVCIDAIGRAPDGTTVVDVNAPARMEYVCDDVQITRHVTDGVETYSVMMFSFDAPYSPSPVIQSAVDNGQYAPVTISVRSATAPGRDTAERTVG